MISSAASAQWRPNPYYFNFKGVKADSVLIVPRDTTYTNVGSEPDSGRLAYKDNSLWIRDGVSWKRLVTPLFRANKVYIPGRGNTYDPLIGGTTVVDPTLKGWTYSVRRIGLEYMAWYVGSTDWIIDPDGGFTIPYDYPFIEGDVIEVIFYPKGILLLGN